MADVTLTAELRANVDNLNRGMATAVNTVVRGSNQIDAAAGRASQALRGINPASGQAANALTNLGRVAQDAPFGFIGIQNNINPLLESFQRLRAEAGSNVGAFKALISSLTGAAGLGIAISLVTSALTIYTQYQQRSTHATKEAKNANEEYLKSATNDVASLVTLYSASQNVNLSLGERKAAVDQLQSTYPAYFKNLSDEAILAGKAKSAYDNLTNSIINQAIVKAGQDKIETSLKPLIESIIEQRKLQAEIDKSNADAQRRNPSKSTSFALSDQNGKIIPGMRDVVAGRSNRIMQQFVDDETEAAEKLGNSGVRSVQEYQNNLRKAIVKAKDDVQSLLGEFGINSLIDPNKGGGATEKGKEGFAILEEQISKIKTALEAAVISNKPNVIDALSISLTTATQKLEELTKKYNNSLLAGKGAPDLVLPDPSSNVSPNGRVINDGGTEALLSASKAMKENLDLRGQSTKAVIDYNKELSREYEIGKEITKVFGGGLTDAFQSALEGTQSFVSAMGQFLVGLVTKLLAAAAAAAVLAVILSAVGFGAGVGGAVTAAGSFKNLFAGFSGLKLAEGGITTGPTFAMIGEGREQEVVAPLSKFDAMVNNRAAQSGGNGKFEPILIGGDLLLRWQDRAQKSNSRRR